MYNSKGKTNDGIDWSIKSNDGRTFTITVSSNGITKEQDYVSKVPNFGFFDIIDLTNASEIVNTLIKEVKKELVDKSTNIE